jgi:hypothetical protein
MYAAKLKRHLPLGICCLAFNHYFQAWLWDTESALRRRSVLVNIFFLCVVEAH